MDIDKLIKMGTSLTVVAVASFAAIISYSHIYDLGRTHSQGGYGASFLPLSVDGLILAASLVLLYAARERVAVPFLARFTLWLGIGATVAANVTYGIPGGPVAAIVSAWPALSFVLTIETVMQIARSKRIRARRVHAPKDTGEVRNLPKPKQEIEIHDVAEQQELPTYAAIRAELGCGQAMAKDLRSIMLRDHVDLHKAQLIREEAKNG